MSPTSATQATHLANQVDLTSPQHLLQIHLVDSHSLPSQATVLGILARDIANYSYLLRTRL